MTDQPILRARPAYRCFLFVPGAEPDFPGRSPPGVVGVTVPAGGGTVAGGAGAEAEADTDAEADADADADAEGPEGDAVPVPDGLTPLPPSPPPSPVPGSGWISAGIPARPPSPPGGEPRSDPWSKAVATTAASAPRTTTAPPPAISSGPGPRRFEACLRRRLGPSSAPVSYWLTNRDCREHVSAGATWVTCHPPGGPDARRGTEHGARRPAPP
ncbi:hypothetical protein GCM10019017_30890 [Streptomyces showdoensis]